MRFDEKLDSVLGEGAIGDLATSYKRKLLAALDGVVKQYGLTVSGAEDMQRIEIDPIVWLAVLSLGQQKVLAIGVAMVGRRTLVMHVAASILGFTGGEAARSYHDTEKLVEDVREIMERLAVRVKEVQEQSVEDQRAYEPALQFFRYVGKLQRSSDDDGWRWQFYREFGDHSFYLEVVIPGPVTGLWSREAEIRLEWRRMGHSEAQATFKVGRKLAEVLEYGSASYEDFVKVLEGTSPPITRLWNTAAIHPDKLLWAILRFLAADDKEPLRSLLVGKQARLYEKVQDWMNRLPSVMDTDFGAVRAELELVGNGVKVRIADAGLSFLLPPEVFVEAARRWQEFVERLMVGQVSSSDEAVRVAKEVAEGA